MLSYSGNERLLENDFSSEEHSNAREAIQYQIQTEDQGDIEQVLNQNIERSRSNGNHNSCTNQKYDDYFYQSEQHTESDQTSKNMRNKPRELRKNFRSRLAFIFASIGAAVGFGNFFRFPHIVYKHKGGAFLVPYIISLITIGISMCLLEFSLGQISRLSIIYGIGRWNRRAGSIGLAATVFGSFIIGAYYNVMIGWIFIYLVNIFQKPLPWSEDSSSFFMEQVVKSPSKEHTFDNIFLNWQVLVCSLIVWIIVFFCVFKGVEWTSYIVYLTVPLPVLLLLIIFFRVLFEEGALNGIKTFFTPDFKELLKPDIWLAAAGQIFFSLGVANGVMCNFASHLDTKHDIVKNNLVIVIINSFFSLFMGTVVFSILGFMANKTDKGIDDVIEKGLGLVFITIPHAISLLPVPHVFNILLLLAMFTLAIDSSFAAVDNMICVVHDRYPNHRKWVVAMTLCAIGFIAGIPFCFSMGYNLTDFVDHYVSDFCLVLIGLLECIFVGYLSASSGVDYKDSVYRRRFEMDMVEREENQLDHLTNMNKINGVQEEQEETFETNYMKITDGIINQEHVDDQNEELVSGDLIALWKKKYPSKRIFPHIRIVWNLFWKNPKRYWRPFFFFSVDRIEKRVAENSRFRPSALWCFSIKYLTPLLLFTFLVSQIVKDVQESVQNFNPGKFVTGFITVGFCLFLIITFTIVPLVRKREELGDLKIHQ